MLAKKFFFACAGLLCLALAYHLGAQGAGAQAGDQVVDVAWRRADSHAYAVTTSGAIFATPGHCQAWSSVGQMPVGCLPVAVLDGDTPVGGSMDFLCSDGRVYTVTGDVPAVSLVPCSNVFGTPTPVQQSTWGSVKVRYR